MLAYANQNVNNKISQRRLKKPTALKTV